MNVQIQGNEFIYEPLDSTSDQIRLLDIAPGRPGRPVECTLETIRVGDDLEWQALSYVWGETQANLSINVNGKSVQVADNLFDALHRIRSATARVRLWVDALCIDQNNPVEKTQQVNMMRRIYANSGTCYVWLGAIDNTSQCSLEAARRALSCIRYFAQIHVSEQFPHDLATGAMQEEARHGLEALMDLPWWKRMWTVQEAAIPPNCQALWGPLEIEWNSVTRAARNITNPQLFHRGRALKIVLERGAHFSLGFYTAPVVWLLNAGRDCTPSRTTPTLGMLYRFRYRQAGDPRDKVYAVPGLISQHQTLLPSIPSCDYTLDVVTLYKRVTLDLIRAEGSLRVLIGRRGESTSVEGLPSWTLDWWCPGPPAGHFYAHEVCFWPESAASQGLPKLALDLLTKPEEDDEETLHLQGILLDSVSLVSPSILNSSGMARYDRTHILQTASTIQRDFGPSSPEGRAGKNLETMATGQFLADSPRTHDGIPLMKYWQQNAFTNQSWFITEGGYAGLGAATMQPGDEIWILASGNVPFVLRRFRSSQEGDHAKDDDIRLLVGDAFIPEIRHGEAVREHQGDLRSVKLR
jgi:hypothetical protein